MCIHIGSPLVKVDKERIEAVDEAKKAVSYSVIEGDLVKYYKNFKAFLAVTPKGENFVFNFYDYVLNQNLSEQRFVYDAPSSANNYNNFLFSE